MIHHFHCCQPCVPPERHIGCHATCEKYITAKQKRDRLVEQERQSQKGLIESWEMRQASIERTKRRCHDRKEKKI